MIGGFGEEVKAKIENHWTRARARTEPSHARKPMRSEGVRGSEQMKVKFVLVVLLLLIFVSVLFICLVVLRNELPTVHSV